MRSGGYKKWLVVALLWIVACLNYMDRMTIFAIFPLLQRQMHVSNVALAMLGSVFLWAYGVCSPIGEYLGDQFNRKTVILCSLIVFSVVTFATGLAHSQTQLITLRIFLGISEALFLPAALAHVAAFHSNSTRSLANAVTLTGLPAGAGLGGLYGGFMAEHYSWRAGFYLLGAAGFILLLVLLAWLPNEESVPKQKLGGWAKRNGRGRIWVQLMALSLMAPAMLVVGFIVSERQLTYDLLVYSIARGMLEVNSMPIFSSVMPPNKWATAYGLYNFAGTMAGSFGILFVGYMKTSWGIGRSLSLMSVILFCAIVIMALTPLHLSPERNVEEYVS